MKAYPRVGLVLMRANWSGCRNVENLIESIQSDAQEIVSRLEQRFQMMGPWVIDSAESLLACQQVLQNTDLDVILLVFQTWAEDSHLVALLQAIGERPLVVWCYTPWRRLVHPASFIETTRGSGPVGTFGALGTLRNLEFPFLFTFGAPDDPRLIRDLMVAGQAANVRKALRSARFGVIPSRSEQMQYTFVDESRLKADIGPVVEHISVDEYNDAVGAVPQDRVNAYLEKLREQSAIEGVSEDTLNLAARCALALSQLASTYRLDVLAVNDAAPELQRTFHMRPGLYPDLLEPSNVLFQSEGDLGAATANFVLQRLTGSPTMLLELWSWDEPRNQIVGGHAGLQNPAIAEPDQVLVTCDYDLCRPEGCEGVQYQLIARPGRMTLFQLRSTPKGWQAIAASGVCLESQPWVDGYPHAILRLDGQIEHFLNRVAAVGATPHWVMAYGSVLNELEAFCQMQKIPLEVIAY